MSRLVLDIETDGLLVNQENNDPNSGEFSRIWCMCLLDVDTGVCERFFDFREIVLYVGGYGGDLDDGLHVAQEADLLITHGGTGFDIPAIQKVYPWFKPPQHYDTLVGARLQFPHIADHDFRHLKRGFPSNLVGSHSLEAWGHRLKQPKGDHQDWSRLTQEMLDYCEQDTRVTLALFKFLMSRRHPAQSNRIEHDFAPILARQMRVGVGFDEPVARALVSKLELRQGEVARELKEILPPSVKLWMTPKQRKFRSKEVPLNLNSRTQVANALTFRYDWEPPEYNDDGTPKFDKDTLEAIHPNHVPCIELIREYFKTADVLGTLAYGKKALLQHVVQVGPGHWRIYGPINHNGARTGRCTHQVVANIPRVGSTWGLELRSLFVARPGWCMVGADMSGIEARGMAHYLEPYDGGALTRRILEGDIHTQNWEAIRSYCSTRQDAKNVLYAVGYGASGEKVAQMLGIPKRDGKKVKRIILQEAIPGLGALVEDTQDELQRFGFLTGLDGRKIVPRKIHSAFNAKIQSFGAVVMKVATKIKEDMLAGERDLYEQVIHYHDEYECEAHPSVAERVREVLEEAIVRAGEVLGVKCPLAGEGKIGKNWAEVH